MNEPIRTASGRVVTPPTINATRRAPTVMAAAQRQARLHRDHNDAPRVDVKNAGRILRWICRASPAATTDVDAYLAAYPDLIALACILAAARRQIWNT